MPINQALAQLGIRVVVYLHDGIVAVKGKKRQSVNAKVQADLAAAGFVVNEILLASFEVNYSIRFWHWLECNLYISFYDQGYSSTEPTLESSKT